MIHGEGDGSVLVTIMLMGGGELAARPLDAGLAGSEPMVLSYNAQRDSSVVPATMAPSRAPSRPARSSLVRPFWWRCFWCRMALHAAGRRSRRTISGTAGAPWARYSTSATPTGIGAGIGVPSTYS